MNFIRENIVKIVTFIVILVVIIIVFSFVFKAECFHQSDDVFP